MSGYRYNNVDSDGEQDPGNFDEYEQVPELGNIYDDDSEEEDEDISSLNSRQVQSKQIQPDEHEQENFEVHQVNSGSQSGRKHYPVNESMNSERHYLPNEMEEDDFEVHNETTNEKSDSPDIEFLLNEHSGSMSNRSLFQRSATGAGQRPLSAKTRQSPPSSARPSSAGRTSSSGPAVRAHTASSLRNKLQLPPKLSSIPPPERFPISSSRSTTSTMKLGTGSPKHRRVVDAYLSNVNKNMKRRKIPQKFHKDPEGMYMDLQQLKQEISAVREENTKLKTQLHMTEAKKTKKQKQIDELLRAHSLVENKGSHYENMFKEANVRMVETINLDS
jgi:hypothetical protein